MIYTVRTTSGRERIVVDLLASKVKSQGIDIKTIFHPAEIKGYVFVEGSLGQAQKLAQGVMHVRGLIEKPVNLDEIRHFLVFEKEKVKVNLWDEVEIIGGPFKGERGKVQRIDKVKNEVTVELLEASIPIPVTITTEFVKVTKPAKVEVKEEAEEAAFGVEEEDEEDSKEEKGEESKGEYAEVSDEGEVK